MTAILQKHFIRSSRAMRHLEYFLISAIVTILTVRLFLEVTGYPKIGGDSSIHVAHVLWGGLLMAAAILILFFFLSRGAENLAALAGGAGFGLFIDEVGKFVTQDNNYFFQPAVAIMYVTFVVIFLVARYILSGRFFSSAELLSNTINEMKEIPAGNFREDIKNSLLAELKKSGADDPLAVHLRKIIENSGAAPAARPGIYERLKNRWRRKYETLVNKRWFYRVIVIFFVLQALGTTGVVLTLMFDRGSLEQQIDTLSLADWAILGSNTVSGLYVIWGLLLLRRSRLNAFQMFERSLLIAIFISQFFLFLQDGFSALPSFFFDLLLLIAVRFMLQDELTASQMFPQEKAAEAVGAT